MVVRSRAARHTISSELECFFWARGIKIIIVNLCFVLFICIWREISKPDVYYFVSTLLVHSHRWPIWIGSNNIRWLKIQICFWLFASRLECDVGKECARESLIAEVIYSRVSDRKGRKYIINWYCRILSIINGELTKFCNEFPISLVFDSVKSVWEAYWKLRVRSQKTIVYLKLRNCCFGWYYINHILHDVSANESHNPLVIDGECGWIIIC